MKKYLLMLASCLMFVSCQSVSPTISKQPDLASKKTVDIRCTAYTSSEKDHKKYKKLTACGTQLQPGTLATDWSQFPVNTILRINGVLCKVRDYGSFIIKARERSIPTVDVYQPTRKQMNRFGVKYVDNVEIVQFGDYQKSLDILKDRLNYQHCRLMYEQILKKI